jgi:3-isopropylmalate dehydrogenase
VTITTPASASCSSKESTSLTGSLGMLASASIGGKIGLYEPSHGSAPKYTGMKRANPIATILSAAMLLRFSLNLEEEADAIERAVTKVLDLGYRTADLMEEGKELVNTVQMGDRLVEQIDKEL